MFRKLFDALGAGALRHPQLGRLRFVEDAWWEGQWESPGRTVALAVAGGAQGPDAAQAARLVHTLQGLAALEAQVLAYVREELPERLGGPTARVRVRGLRFLWPEDPDAFTVDLAVAGYAEGVWSVDFVRGRPEHLSRDP